jgi:hypothetical protein
MMMMTVVLYGKKAAAGDDVSRLLMLATCHLFRLVVPVVHDRPKSNKCWVLLMMLMLMMTPTKGWPSWAMDVVVVAGKSAWATQLNWLLLQTRDQEDECFEWKVRLTEQRRLPPFQLCCTRRPPSKRNIDEELSFALFLLLLWWWWWWGIGDVSTVFSFSLGWKHKKL